MKSSSPLWRMAAWALLILNALSIGAICCLALFLTLPSLLTTTALSTWPFALLGIGLRLLFLMLGIAVAIPIAIPFFVPNNRTWTLATAWFLLIPSVVYFLLILSISCLAVIQGAFSQEWLLYPCLAIYLALPVTTSLRAITVRGSTAPSLLRPSFADGFAYARMFKGFFPQGVDRLKYLEASDPAVVIARLEPSLKAQNTNWHVRYLLGDWYMRARRYVDALNALLQARDLRPKDPRSSYALATAYRVLARASLEGTDIRQAMAPHLAELRAWNPELHRKLLAGLADFDPTASADELERLGLTIDAVASRALEFFELTLAVGTRPEETSIVDQSLQSM